MNRFRILIVDDDPGQRARLALALGSHFEIAVARSGHEALKKLASIEPDIVIAVSQLTDMDGEEFITELRAIREYRETLVLLTAVRASHETIDPDKPVVSLMETNSDVRAIGETLVREIGQRGLVAGRKGNTLDALRENAASEAGPLPPQSAGQTASKTPQPGARAPQPGVRPSGAQPTPPPGARKPFVFPMPKKDGKQRVMIVDDDVDVQNILRIALGTKYRVYAAGDGLDGINQAQLHRPDLFIVDWMMPKVTGPQLIKMLRASPLFAKTPVIVITAKTQAPQSHMLDDLGVKIYISKPFDVGELTEAVDRELAAAAGGK